MYFVICYIALWTITSLKWIQAEDRLCEPPQDFPNAQIISRTSDDYAVDTIIDYRCDPGYGTEGDGSIQCVVASDGSTVWTPSNVTCIKGACMQPPVIDRGQILDISDEQYGIGTIVRYGCEFGFAITGGHRTIQCILDNSGTPIWTEAEITCTPRSCGDPGYLWNGRMIGSVFTFPSNVTYVCDDGYLLRGRATRFCQTNGEWSGSLPMCEKIQCGQPPDPENGRVIIPSLSFGSELQYECDKSYKLEEYGPRTCLSNGQWSGEEPRCVEVSCPYPDAPTNGKVRIADNRRQVGSLAIYSCNDGLKLMGVSSSKCLSSGDWTFPPPKCLEPCIIPDVSNGQIGQYSGSRYSKRRFNKADIERVVKDGETFHLKCDERHEVCSKNKSEIEITCTGGEWSTPLCCVPASCKTRPPDVTNGDLFTKERNHGVAITYHCKSFAKKIATGNTTCYYGRWIGKRPTCKDTRCYRKDLEFGGLISSQKNTYKNAESFVPVCSEGYVKRNGNLTCVEGQWNGQIPPCTPANCNGPPPTIEHGKIKEYSEKHGMSVVYSCDENYVLETLNSKVVCNLGKWEGRHPLCRDAQCKLTDLPKQQGVKLDSEVILAPYEVAKDICEEGYSQKFEPQCSDGKWNVQRNNQICEEKKCKVFPFDDGQFQHEVKKRKWTFKGWHYYYEFEKATLGHKYNPGTELYIQCWKPYIFQGRIYQNNVPVKCSKGKWTPDPVCLSPGSNYKATTQATRITSTIASPLATTTKSGHRVLDVSKTEILTTEATTPRGSGENSFTHDGQLANKHKFCNYTLLDENVRAYSGNSYLKFGDRVSFGNIVKFSCSIPGYHRFRGNHQLVCDSEWHSSELPSCDPPVDGDVVISMKRDDGGIIFLTPDGKNRIPMGVKVLLSCNIVNRNNWAIWKVLQGTGHVDYNQNTFETVVHLSPLQETNNGLYTCGVRDDPQYDISVEIEAYELQCSEIPKQDGMDIVYDNDRYIDSTATFHCRQQRVRSGVSRLTCQNNGLWSGDPPTCDSVPRSPTNVRVSDVTITSVKLSWSYDGSDDIFYYVIQYKPKQSNQEYSEITGITAMSYTIHQLNPYTEYEFYVIAANQVGRGSPSTAVVAITNKTEKQCPAFAEDGTLEVTYTNDRRIGSAAAFSCTGLDSIQGNAEVKCLQNSQWSGPVPTCESPSCDIADIYIGDIIPEGVVVDVRGVKDSTVHMGATVQLTCDGAGHYPVGVTNATCGRNKKWIVGSVTCVSGCHPIIPKEGSELMISPQNDMYVFGDSITFSCPPGQQLTTNVERTVCLSQGWSEYEHIPDCKVVE